MAFGEFFPVGTENHGHVAVLRQCAAQRPQNINLTRGVVNVVIAANNVGDLHIPVVDNDTKIVCGRAIGACNNQVVQFAIVNTDGAFNEVVPACCSVLGGFETHDRFAVLRHRGQCFTGFRSPGSVVTGF